MKRVLTAVILIPLVILALFRAPLWLFTLLVLGVALLAAREYFDIAEKTGFRPMRGWDYAFLTLLFVTVAIALSNSNYAGRPAHDLGEAGLIFCICASVALVLSPYVLLTMSMRRERLAKSLGDAAISFLLLPYVGVNLVLLLPLRGPEYGSLYVLFTMLLVWCGDIAAFYVGHAIGKNKLAPQVSPGKTWEGAVASAAAAILIAVLLLRFINPIASALTRSHLMRQAAVSFDLPGHVHTFPLAIPMFPVTPIWLAAIFGLCINVAAQFSDLVESALKRGADVKDSGTLLPGHGGVLDRIDALLFALPIAFLFYLLVLGSYFEPYGLQRVA